MEAQYGAGSDFGSQTFFQFTGLFAVVLLLNILLSKENKKKKH
jgi:hypothetical protein